MELPVLIGSEQAESGPTTEWSSQRGKNLSCREPEVVGCPSHHLLEFPMEMNTFDYYRSHQAWVPVGTLLPLASDLVLALGSQRDWAHG